jgi:hypothetical protein
MANLAKFSEHGLNKMYRRVDIDSLSDRAKIIQIRQQLPDSTWDLNTTLKHNIGSVGIPGTIVSAYLSQATLVAGGTLTGKIVAYDASANAEVNLTDTINPEAATAREGQALTLATTNMELAADDTLEFHATADNNAVTDGTDVVIVINFAPTEETTLTE